MPLHNCKECGEQEAGYWHCEYKRMHKYDFVKFMLKQMGYFALIFIIAWLLARYS